LGSVGTGDGVGCSLAIVTNNNIISQLNPLAVELSPQAIIKLPSRWISIR